MAKVLRAEQEARDAIEACSRTAEQMVAMTRQRVRRIAERTDSRIGALHTRCGEALSASVESLLRAEDEGVGAQPDTLREQVLATAVERLARRLSGGRDEP